MATARKTTSKTAKAAPVTREELTQITKALTALAKEVKSLKAQLSTDKLTSTTSDRVEELEARLKKWASSEAGGDKEILYSILNSKKI